MDETIKSGACLRRARFCRRDRLRPHQCSFCRQTNHGNRTCHARGIRSLFPSARIIIDIGGQDSKGIKLDEAGKVANFVMNDKCAAGTGRFLEVISETLGINRRTWAIWRFRPTASSRFPTRTVFAEHEVTSRLAEGAGVAEIVAGLHEAIASRVVNMTRHLHEKDVVVTGGGAKTRGWSGPSQAGRLSPVLTPPELFITGSPGSGARRKGFLQPGSQTGKRAGKEGSDLFYLTPFEDVSSSSPLPLWERVVVRATIKFLFIRSIFSSIPSPQGREVFLI